MSPEQETGTLADLMRDDPDNTGVMAAMPSEMQAKLEISKLSTRLMAQENYITKMGEHIDFMLFQLEEANARRDWLQEQVSKDSFWMNQARECLRIFPADWEIILKTLIERQANTQAMLEELMTFIKEDNFIQGSKSIQAVQTRLSQLKKFVAGIKPHGNMEMPAPNNADAIHEFLDAALRSVSEE